MFLISPILNTCLRHCCFLNFTSLIFYSTSRHKQVLCHLMPEERVTTCASALTHIHTHALVYMPNINFQNLFVSIFYHAHYFTCYFIRIYFVIWAISYISVCHECAVNCGFLSCSLSFLQLLSRQFLSWSVWALPALGTEYDHPRHRWAGRDVEGWCRGL